MALITDAGSGIGAGCCALEFIAQGWNVALNFIDPAMSAAIEGIRMAAQQRRRDVLSLRGDVGRDDDCHAIAASALEAFGRIDASINYAGITNSTALDDLDALRPEDFHCVYGVTGGCGTHDICDCHRDAADRWRNHFTRCRISPQCR
ncbi:MAG: SDR family oxidoreductase [Variovorax sp.]